MENKFYSNAAEEDNQNEGVESADVSPKANQEDEVQRSPQYKYKFKSNHP